ncbi:alpha/beta hydrolase [Mucilaginibacter segetis]|uniref:Alpha/beta hydrolase n=1 Tax=Mucilaginibacter segetis TaxID=2793071 RepID=A0A934UNG3_9SPHI|nr:alpha/beta hydrolase [Mucilaginibacter segetis]MBK0379882.1 alpha/beta hydrolase [Mucilaginibacter segetis]
MTRLILLFIFFLISLLSVFKAPAYYVWLLAVLVTDFPLIFVTITSILTFLGVWVNHYRVAGNLVGVLAILLYLSPIVRTAIIARDIKSNMLYAFRSMYANSSPDVLPKEGPGNFFKLFTVGDKGPFKTFTYVKYQDTSLTLDFYQSEISGKRPCVLVIHGGSWSSGDSRQLPELNTYLAQRGYNVAAINYRLAPEYQTPAPIEDVEAAISYLQHHADELHIDTNKFVLLGRSAGAQIALLAAYTQKFPGLRGVVDFYGPADMVWGYSIPSNPLIMDSRKVMEDYIGGTYNAVPGKYVACSPLEFVNQETVPTLIIHGGNDVLVSPEHSRRLNAKLKHYDVPHYWLKLPWATHGFDFNMNGPGGQLSTYATLFFLNTITK